MKKCWDPNPNNRPNAKDEIELFRKSDGEIKEAYEYRRANLSAIENNQTTTHPQAIYISIT